MRLPKPIVWLTVIALLGLATLAWAGPAYADHEQAATTQLVRWAGCHAKVVTSDVHSVLDSYYDGEALFIGTAKDTPYDVWLMVMLHETAHCLQHQQLGEGMEVLYYLDPKSLELDADHWAAALACGLGLNGSKMLHDLFVWAYKEYGYTGDDYHGTLTERIHAGDNTCGPSPLEAPLKGHVAL